jgi:hypothetical protein
MSIQSWYLLEVFFLITNITDEYNLKLMHSASSERLKHLNKA